MDWIINPGEKFSNTIWKFLYEVTESIYGALAYLIGEMIKLIVKIPLLKEFPEVYSIWKFMLLLSFTFVTVVLMYTAFKNMLSMGSNIIRSTDMKIVFARMLYMLVFSVMSLPFIDWLITFNNTLVDALVLKFNINSSFDIGQLDIKGNLVAAALVIFQMFLIIKVMVGYWIRIAEIMLMAVISPPLFVLWINPSWGGYINEWVRRLVTLIFTSFIQVLIMVFYNMLMIKFFDHGTISALCIGAGMLWLMGNAPTVLSRFVARDNSVQMVNNTIKRIKGLPDRALNNYNNARSFPSKAAGAPGKIIDYIRKFK